jgi:hypothetical protein
VTEKSIEKSEGFNYRGVSWFFNIQKVERENGALEYFYSVILGFENDVIEVDLMEVVWRNPSLFSFCGVVVEKFEGFKSNYYSQMKQWAEGFAWVAIDNKLENVDAERLEELIIARDETNNRKGAWKPRTRPTQLQQVAMKKITSDLISMQSEKKFSEILGVSESSIRGWKMKGIIPPYMAMKIDENKSLRAFGFTKESLRPDITEWPTNEV